MQMGSDKLGGGREYLTGAAPSTTTRSPPLRSDGVDPAGGARDPETRPDPVREARPGTELGGAERARVRARRASGGGRSDILASTGTTKHTRQSPCQEASSPDAEKLALERELMEARPPITLYRTPKHLPPSLHLVPR